MRSMKPWVPAIAVMSLFALPAVTYGGSAAEGRKAFDAKKCISCHSLGSETGKMAKLGGPLDGVGAKHDAAWFEQLLKDPKAAGSKMPKVGLTEADLGNIVEYLLSLK